MLLAVSNSKYEFTYVDIGTNGRVSDAGVWANSGLKHFFESGPAQLTEPCDLPNSVLRLPYVLVAADAFPMTNYMLKPYPFRNQNNEQRIFSYRLSRARRVENAFGILASKFRVLYKPINLHQNKVEKIVLACVALHNMLCKEMGDQYIQQGTIDEELSAQGSIRRGEWRQDTPLLDLHRVLRRNL